MEYNDMFVIIYQVLRYMYDCLKEGQKIEVCYLKASRYSIPNNYWNFIVTELLRKGYIEGITIVKAKDGILLDDIQDAFITYKGVEFLSENSLLKKAKEYLKM